MRFLIEHTFINVDLERFLEIYFSDAFNQHVDPQIGVELRDPVEHREQPDGRICRRTRVVPQVRLPLKIRKLTGLDRIEYHEISTFHPDQRCLDFCIEHRAQQHLRVWGDIRFAAVERGVRRSLELNVEVDVPLARRLTERFIEAELRKSYDRKAVLTQRWIDRRGEAGG